MHLRAEIKKSIHVLLALGLIAAPSPLSVADAKPSPRGAELARPWSTDAVGDATVVAVIDLNFVPYHWDFLAKKMPQSLDGIASNDLPLGVPPHKWLPGFPSSKSFDSYSALELNLDPRQSKTTIGSLVEQDRDEWGAVQSSDPDNLHYYWMPDTKVIGAVNFGSTKMMGSPGSHGQGSTSSSVGNLHGTCPECLLVFVNIAGAGNEQIENAIEWTMAQPWIDVITNSYGLSSVGRNRLYSGSDVEAQRTASERGQTIFFSAGNGNDGSFWVPNTTSFSSQEGPDWIITVGAISPGEDNYYYRRGADANERTSYHAAYSGAGKPVDIAGIGGNYPSAYTALLVGATGDRGFGGTSNATPQIAGTYARALYIARRDLKGPSRAQRGGTIAVGGGFTCGDVRTDCELGDGKLTAAELRRRLFYGAATAAGTTIGGHGQVPWIAEERFMGEGHGSYFGRETGRARDWLQEFDRIVGPMEGRAKESARVEGEKEWMIVDSFCRQHLWGSWKGGYYEDGKTNLPDPDPLHPVRTATLLTCPYLEPPVSIN